MGTMVLTILLLSAALFAEGVTSFKCNEGTNGLHGFPLDIEPHDCEAGVINCAKTTGTVDTESVQAWSCGLKTAQSGCVAGIPDGVQLNVGETIDNAVTCFCSDELCNGEHFCDGCTAGSGVDRIAATVLTILIV